MKKQSSANENEECQRGCIGWLGGSCVDQSEIWRLGDYELRRHSPE